MAASAAVDSISDDNWTVVLRRSNRRRRTPSDCHRRPPFPTATLPSSPVCLPAHSCDPEPVHISSLFARIHSAKSLLQQTRFHSRIFDGGPLRRLLSFFSSESRPLSLVVLGIGSFDASLPSRLQLAFSILLKNALNVASASLFDPVLSPAECHAARQLGFAVPMFDTTSLGKIDCPTLFYMPHCEVGLYNEVLRVNWDEKESCRMVVIGNSFKEYEKSTHWGGVVSPAAGAQYVLDAARFIDEVPFGFGEKEEEADGMFRAFNNTSMHFFHVNEDTKLVAANL